VNPHKRWWLEWELWLVLLLAAATDTMRMTATVLCGEESRRGQVAREMLATGDFLVPRLQGEPFLSRPPLQNWAIALVGALHVGADEVAVRVPSAVAVLLTVLLIYGYCRRFMSGLGAMVAAVAYATMGHMLQLGRLGETEAIYTLLVGGSLLAWHWADCCGRPGVWGWLAGYGLAGLGMLTKGPQAPAYFAAGVGLFLLVTRRWRELLRWPHAAGILMFLAVWAAWEVPFACRVGPAGAWKMLTADIGMRFQHPGWSDFFRHLVTFPLEVVGCMLPWSVLLTAYLWPGFRRSLRSGMAQAAGTADPAAVHVRFLLYVIAATFPSCWLVTGARNRYFAPIYPCIVPLIGLAADRCCAALGAAVWTKTWRRFLLGMGLLMPGAGLGVAVATLLGWGPGLGQQPPLFAGVYLAACAALGLATFWAAGRPLALPPRLGALAVAAFLGLSYTGAVTNALRATGQPVRQNVAQLKERLPREVRLVSIGPVEPMFAYYYGQPIRQIPKRQLGAHWHEDWEYFCTGYDQTQPECSFPFEELGSVSCNPMAAAAGKNMVLVGRRLKTDSAARPAPEYR
jgi:4-amino-4-deoxy-L-arabinose transferase-like glycosyltransferase